MPRVKVTRAARRDLIEIGRFSAERWGEEQATRYLTQLDARFRSLAGEPTSGRSCDQIRPGYWYYREGRHVIFYKFNRRSVEIVRILHDRMLPRRHL